MRLTRTVRPTHHGASAEHRTHSHETTDTPLERAHKRAAPTNPLTLTQEQEIVSDPKLFLVAWLVVNRTQFEEIVRAYRFTEPELLRYLLKLDRLKVIELQPGNKVRLLVSRRFTWRAGGPVQKYIHQKLLREFLASHFSDSHEDFFFHGGEITDAALVQLKRALQNAARECVEIIERDRGVEQAKRGAAFALALRPVELQRFRGILAGLVVGDDLLAVHPVQDLAEVRRCWHSLWRDCRALFCKQNRLHARCLSPEYATRVLPRSKRTALILRGARLQLR